MSGAILEMKNISKNFGSVIALKNVNLEVYPGEIRGLIGENGSGKSTISSIAAGMQKSNSWRNVFQRKILGANQYDLMPCNMESEW